MREPFDRVTPDAAIALRDVRPFDVRSEVEKNTLGTLVGASRQHDFVAFAECWIRARHIRALLRSLFLRPASVATHGMALATTMACGQSPEKLNTGTTGLKSNASSEDGGNGVMPWPGEPGTSRPSRPQPQ
jgi:hypothetical protein